MVKPKSSNVWIRIWNIFTILFMCLRTNARKHSLITKTIQPKCAINVSNHLLLKILNGEKNENVSEVFRSLRVFLLNCKLISVIRKTVRADSSASKSKHFCFNFSIRRACDASGINYANPPGDVRCCFPTFFSCPLFGGM